MPFFSTGGIDILLGEEFGAEDPDKILLKPSRENDCLRKQDPEYMGFFENPAGKI